MFEQWFRPDSITYTRLQVIWLLQHFDDIGEGKWPAYPKEAARRIDPSLSEQELNSKATREKIASIASEFNARLDMVGRDIVVLLTYFFKDRYTRGGNLLWIKATPFIDWSEKKTPNGEIKRKVNNCLSYIEGQERKSQPYKEWLIRQIMERSLFG